MGGRNKSHPAGVDDLWQATWSRWLTGSRVERLAAYNGAFCLVKDAAMRLLGVSDTTLEDLYKGIVDQYSQGRMTEHEFRAFDSFWVAWREFAELWKEPPYEMPSADLATFIKLARLVESDLEAASRRPVQELLAEPCPPSAS